MLRHWASAQRSAALQEPCCRIRPTLPRRYCVQVQELVWTLVVLLDLGTADLVMAFYMLELCARAQRGLFKPNALRRLLIGCCVIARKLNTDARRVSDERGPS